MVEQINCSKLCVYCKVGVSKGIWTTSPDWVGFKCPKCKKVEYLKKPEGF